MKLCGLALACCVPLAAAEVASAQAERERIKAERASVMATFDAQERTCQTQFVVTSCVDAARKEQRAALTRLNRQEMQLDDAARREAAAARTQAVRDKGETQAARASGADSAGQNAGKARAPRPVESAPRDVASAPRTGPTPAEQRAIEERNVAAFDERASAAQAHRKEVEQRNAQRRAQGKVVAPLPVPAGASAP